MGENPSRMRTLLARMVIIPMVVFVVVGTLMYGRSVTVLERI
jgi:hypothetical protein